MSMFCYQCQETVKNEVCTARGVCGKELRCFQFTEDTDLSGEKNSFLQL